MVFVLRRAGRELCATGLRHRLRPGERATLDRRVREALEGTAGQGPGTLVGALPFEPGRPELLYQPEQLLSRELPPRETGAGSMGLFSDRDLREIPSRAEYAAMVERALSRIAGGNGLRKVVLSRQVVLEAAQQPDFERLLAILSLDPDITAYRLDLQPDRGGEPRLLMGATPELLVSRSGRMVASEPLAGSIPRGREPAQDRERARALMASDKDRREHAITVEYILDLLAPLCSELGSPGGMGLRSTATMWHLGTRIEGRLKSADAPTSAGLAALLHPTPAVGGHPRDRALEAIRELESHDRGFYAGAVGHVDSHGDGEWYVALRCAQIEGPRITLHAGAGIVEGSVPDDEVHETAAKFRAMLRALGVTDKPRQAVEAG